MLLRIDHETTLHYSEPVIESTMELRMCPPSSEDQTLLGYRPRVVPQTPLTSSSDGFGNRVELFNVLAPHKEVVLRISSCVRLHRRPGPERARQATAGDWALGLEAQEFVRPSQLTKTSERLRELVASVGPQPETLEEAITRVVDTVHGALGYEKAVTSASTSMAKALELGRGVCQDYAHISIAALRLLGVPAQYVSGYVHQTGEMATHAWIRAWAGPALGWVEYDPTHRIWPADGHVAVAFGRDFDDVPPNRGVWRGASAHEKIAVSVNVQPVDRVPADLTDLTTAPAWTSAAFGAPVNQNRSRLNQQHRRTAYRQQQSQQQQ